MDTVIGVFIVLLTGAAFGAILGCIRKFVDDSKRKGN